MEDKDEIFRVASHMGHACVCKSCLEKLGLKVDDRSEKEFTTLDGKQTKDVFYVTEDYAADTVCEYGDCDNVSEFLICCEC